MNIITCCVAEIQLIDKDEFIILASDGLWDVFSSTQAVQLARTLFKKGLGAQVRLSTSPGA